MGMGHCCPIPGGCNCQFGSRGKGEAERAVRDLDLPGAREQGFKSKFRQREYLLRVGD